MWKPKLKKEIFILNAIQLSNPHENKPQPNGLISPGKVTENDEKITQNGKQFICYLKILPCYTFKKKTAHLAHWTCLISSK